MAAFIIKNWKLIFITGIFLVIILMFKQCNDIRTLKAEAAAKEQELKRKDNNYLASIATLSQAYNTHTGRLTATIKGYEVTVDELNNKYSNLFSKLDDIKSEWKNSKPVTIIEKHFTVTEKIHGIDTRSFTDKYGKGEITFNADTTFSAGNTRTINARVPFDINVFDKKDSVLLSYIDQPFFIKTLSKTASVDFKQNMIIYTGAIKDNKSGQINIWAKTDYPGVNFTVLKGATVKDDENTQSALANNRKSWGIGFNFGGGLMYSSINKTFVPGLTVSFGLNYTFKKYQFGK